MTDYKALEEQYGLSLYPKRDLVAVRGEGALLYDENDNAYIDCAAGIGVASLGHSHPKLVEAIQKQAATLITCPNILYNDTRSKLLEKLVEVTPTNLTQAYLCNSYRGQRSRTQICTSAYRSSQFRYRDAWIPRPHHGFSERYLYQEVS